MRHLFNDLTPYEEGRVQAALSAQGLISEPCNPYSREAEPVLWGEFQRGTYEEMTARDHKAAHGQIVTATA